VRGRALDDKETKVMMRQRSRFPRRQRSGWAFLAVLALLAGACGDDDDDTVAGDSSDGSAESTDTGSTGGDSGAFCQARVDLERAFGAEQPDVDAVTALLEDMEASAPGEVAANAAGLTEVLASAAESGTDPAEDPAFGENISPIDEYVVNECGYEIVEVGAVEYAFEDLPETVPAGVTGLVLNNDGAEPHEMIVFRVNDGVTGSAEELFAAPEDQIQQNLTFAGAAVAQPGASGVTFPELEPGRHVVVCFMPVGGGEDGPPHFMQGMVGEFEVA